MVGQCVSLELLSTQKHAADIYQAYWGHDAVWEYMIRNPVATLSLVKRGKKAAGCFFMASCHSKLRNQKGIASYLWTQPKMKSIKVGNIT